MKKVTIACCGLLLSLGSARSDDFKTSDGKDYKNATVARVEADGIVVKTKGGISKIYFAELPKDVQERFHYDPQKAAAAQAAAVGQAEEFNQANKQAEELDKQGKAASAKQYQQGLRATSKIQQHSGADRPLKYFAAARTKFARTDWTSGESRNRCTAKVDFARRYAVLRPSRSGATRSSR